VDFDDDVSSVSSAPAEIRKENDQLKRQLEDITKQAQSLAPVHEQTAGEQMIPTGAPPMPPPSERPPVRLQYQHFPQQTVPDNSQLDALRSFTEGGSSSGPFSMTARRRQRRPTMVSHNVDLNPDAQAFTMRSPQNYAPFASGAVLRTKSQASRLLQTLNVLAAVSATDVLWARKFWARVLNEEQQYGLEPVVKSLLVGHRWIGLGTVSAPRV
jgi:hypothetical protein